MNVTAEEVAKVIKEAKINDSFKEDLIIYVAKARATLNNYDFTQFFEKIKEKIAEKERTLN